MPPKGASKAKEVVKAAPTTPKPKVNSEAPETPKKSTSARKPKVAAPPRNWRKLPVEDGAAASIEVKYEGTQQAPALLAGGYSMALKLDAPNAFAIVKTTILTEGPHQGLQAIIVRPAKPFNFMDLPENVRNAVYRMYFAPKGFTELTVPIVFDGRRTIDKKPYSKSFADGSKNRVGLLAVNKQVYAEAAALLYTHPLRFESTTLLGDFLIEYRDTRSKVCDVEVKNYKKGARIGLNLLCEAENLHRLRFEVGVTTEADPRKAAKAFYLDASQLLATIGKKKQDKNAGVEIIDFAKGALTTKEGEKVKNYNGEMVEAFTENLMKLCKDTFTPTGWTCWCGEKRGGHICRLVMEARQNEILQREVFMQHSMLRKA